MPENLPKNLPNDLRNQVGGLLSKLRGTICLADWPPAIQQIVTAYAAEQGWPVELNGETEGGLIAEALLDLWERKVRVVLVRLKGTPRQWVEALLPIAQYVVPATGRYPDVLCLESGSCEQALYRLADIEWVCRLVNNIEIARQISKCVTERFGVSSNSAKLSISRTYHHWYRKGLEYLAAAIFQAMSVPSPLYTKREIELPQGFVPREAILDELRTAVREAARTGEWVAVLGMAGTGKTTMLAALAQDEKTRQAFPDGIAVADAKTQSDAVTLARRLVAQVQEPLSLTINDSKQVQALVSERLAGQQVLLIVDDVTKSSLLDGVCCLPPGTAGILTTRLADVADALGVPSTKRIRIPSGMTESEAWELADLISGGITTQDEGIARRVLRLLEYHPHAIRIIAARSRDSGWAAIERMVQDARARLAALGNLDEEKLNVWASLEVWWENEPRLRPYLSALGSLPLLCRLDRETGIAVWQVSPGEAEEIWSALVRTQLVEVLDKERGRYRMHWLVWDFARQKTIKLPWLKRVSLLLWPWRYSGEKALWHFWKIRVPKPKSAQVRWPWWDIIRIPGLKERGLRSLWRWLNELVWEMGLRLDVGPGEWALAARARQRYWIGIIFSVIMVWGGTGLWNLILAAWDAVPSPQIRSDLARPIGILYILWVAATIAAWGAAMVAIEELKRVLWWRLVGQSWIQTDTNED